MGTSTDSNEAAAVVEAVRRGGESYYAEFKSAWTYGPDGREERPIKDVATDIVRTVVAFANSDGGDLLVGVEDNGDVTGIPWRGDQLRFLVGVPQRAALNVELDATVRDVEIEGRRVLWFRTAEHAGEPVVIRDGRCLWRRRAASEPVPPAEIKRRRRHVLGDIGYEAEPEPAARLEDLDLQRLAFESGARNLDTLEELLRYWNLVESRNGTIVLRRAALLLFAHEPLRWHPNNRIRIRHVLGDQEGFGRRLRTHEKEVVAPIASLLDQTKKALGMFYAVDRRDGTLFATSQLVPEDALDECIVNALAHRNYAIEGQAIEILLYPDRMELKSPGRLPEPITIEALKAQRGVHRSRNPIIMRVLRDLGWTRDQGEGMRRIFGAMRQVELEVPELEVVADTFVVRLSTRSIYDDQTQAWIAAYGPFGLRPEDRKFMVNLRRAGGVLSVDKLARLLGASFDEAKAHLVRLERQGLVWRRPKTRTYRLVEAANVPHELALRSFENARVALDAETHLDREQVIRVIGSDDDHTLDAATTRWMQSGILAPAGKGRWRLGTSFLEYLRQRDA